MSLFVDIRKDFGSFVLESHFSSEGGILGFLGASGSGKSMTLRCIAGIETPDRGRIVLNDTVLFDSEKKINLPPQKRKVGYLFQNYGLFPHMTLEKNIETGALWENDRKKRRRMMEEMIEKMHLSGLEEHKPSQLSGGQQQRTALARILVNMPDILLLDEPFSALDSYLREQLVEEMKKILREYGKDVILVSHSRDEIYQLCDRVVILNEGRICGIGAVKEIFADPGSIEGAVLTGCKNIVKAEYVSPHEVRIPEWKVVLETKDTVRSDLCAVGIHAHVFSPEIVQNAFPVILAEEIEEPFEWILKFRYAGMEEEAPLIRWHLTKEKRPQVFPETLGISAEKVMLLYEKDSVSQEAVGNE